MTARRALVAAVVAAALGLAVPDDARPQPPIRIGASVSQTGPYGALGLNQLRGYQLCVKHANERGGVLGRRLQLVVEDDRSDPATAVRIYTRLVEELRVDAVLGPYSSPITDAVADVTEKHRMAMVAPGAAATSIFKKGRRFIFMIFSPGEVYHEGFVELAARRGVRTIAIVHEDSLFTRSIAHGAVELARKRGLDVVHVEAYPPRTTDFGALLERLRAARPEALAAATYFDDAVALTRQMKDRDLNVRMFAVTAGGDLPKFYEVLGRAAEFVYGATQWEPDLASLVREGQLVPVARRYPGAREFVEAYRREFGDDLSYHSACGYSGCQVLLEAVRRAGSLDGDKLRAAIRGLDLTTVYGGFRVNADGVQVAHTMLTFQWQDGRKVIVWPAELAAAKSRFPTPAWTER